MPASPCRPEEETPPHGPLAHLFACGTYLSDVAVVAVETLHPEAQ
jgi:hypothetical protein